MLICLVFYLFQDEKLYNDARINFRESELMIMAFLLRFSLPIKCLEYLLELINCHLPTNIYSPTYKFMKKFPATDNIKKHFQCPSCQEYLEFAENNMEVICTCLLTSKKKSCTTMANIS